MLTQTLDTTGILLMAYASIERYLFIFHGTMTQNHPVLFRYLPVIFCITYPLLYVLGIVLLLSCQSDFIYSAFLCAGECSLDYPFWNAVIWVGNISLPVFLILSTNILLIGRTFYQKNKMKQAQIWFKNRKIILQLVSFAAFYCFAWLSNVILI